MDREPPLSLLDWFLPRENWGPQRLTLERDHSQDDLMQRSHESGLNYVFRIASYLLNIEGFRDVYGLWIVLAICDTFRCLNPDEHVSATELNCVVLSFRSGRETSVCPDCLAENATPEQITAHINGFVARIQQVVPQFLTHPLANHILTVARRVEKEEDDVVADD